MGKVKLIKVDHASYEYTIVHAYKRLVALVMKDYPKESYKPPKVQ